MAKLARRLHTTMFLELSFRGAVSVDWPSAESAVVIACLQVIPADAATDGGIDRTATQRIADNQTNSGRNARGAPVAAARRHR